MIQFDELEAKELRKIYDIPIQYHIKAEEEAARVGDEQFRKIHERKVKVYLKGIGALCESEQKEVIE